MGDAPLFMECLTSFVTLPIRSLKLMFKFPVTWKIRGHPLISRRPKSGYRHSSRELFSDSVTEKGAGFGLGSTFGGTLPV